MFSDDCIFFFLSFVLVAFVELNDRGAWTAHSYIDKFESFWKFDDNVERINENDVSCDEFIERFEKLYKPVVIECSQVSAMWLTIIHRKQCAMINFFIFKMCL